MDAHPLIELRVHGHNKDEGSVGASQRRQQQEAGEIGMVQMATAVVDPWAVMVHFHNTPEGGKPYEESILFL